MNQKPTQESLIHAPLSKSLFHNLADEFDNKKQTQKESLLTILPQDNNFIQLKFSQSNPFFHLQKVFRNNQKIAIAKREKCFQDLITEIHEMTQICSKVLAQEFPQKVECQRTLIMDLENLRSKHQMIKEQNIDVEEKVQSKISIKDCMEEQKEAKCCHYQCGQINKILSQALKKIDQLTEFSQKLSNTIKEEKNFKQMAQDQNQRLRNRITFIDEEKCEQIQKLKKQIQFIKMQGFQMSSQPLSQFVQASTQKIQQKLSNKSQTKIERKPLAFIQKTQIQVKPKKSNEHSSLALINSKLRRYVYL